MLTVMLPNISYINCFIQSKVKHLLSEPFCFLLPFLPHIIASTTHNYLPPNRLVSWQIQLWHLSITSRSSPQLLLSACEILMIRINIFIIISLVFIWSLTVFLFCLSSLINSMCVLGKRLLKDIAIDNCTKEEGGPLWNIFCPVENGGICDEYFKGICAGTFSEITFND